MFCCEVVRKVAAGYRVASYHVIIMYCVACSSNMWYGGTRCDGIWGGGVWCDGIWGGAMWCDSIWGVMACGLMS